MKKSVLSSAIAGALLATSSAAIAQGNTGPAPDLTLPEKGAFTCIEQSLSMVAALIDRQGCIASSGFYTLDGDIDWFGQGSCTIDDTTVQVVTMYDNFRGTHQYTFIVAPGEIDDVDFTFLDGHFWYTGNGEIMYARSDFRLCLNNCAAPDFPGAENYDEHVIKDFYADVDLLPDRFVLDQGLEVITKNNWPRKKYRQTSRYVPPDGGLGVIVIDKVSIAPNNAPQCFIQYTSQADDFGGGIQFSGNVQVMPL